MNGSQPILASGARTTVFFPDCNKLHASELMASAGDNRRSRDDDHLNASRVDVQAISESTVNGRCYNSSVAATPFRDPSGSKSGQNWVFFA